MLSAQSYRQTTFLFAWLLISVGMLSITHSLSRAQEAPVNMAVADDDIENGTSSVFSDSPAPSPPAGEFNLLRLLLKGGVLMIPIFAMSILVNGVFELMRHF